MFHKSGAIIIMLIHELITSASNSKPEQIQADDALAISNLIFTLKMERYFLVCDM